MAKLAQTKKIAPLSACLRGDRVAFKAKVIGVESCKQLETLVKFMDGDVIDSSCLDTSDDMRLLDPGNGLCDDS